MKENPDIEELLNSFIDGELTARQQMEAQRLISHDARVAQQLRELQKCKMLISSLPFDEAPAEMAEGIKTLLERRAPLGQPPFLLSPEGTGVRFDERAGARHLMFRKVLAAAAMIGLFAVLTAVIYTIVAPESGVERPVAIEDWGRPAGKIKPAEKLISEATLAATGFNGRLELKTDALVAVNSFINRAIEDNGLLEKISSKAEEDKGVYSLSCSRQGLNLLLADLQNIWARFDSATLFVETEAIYEQVVVDGVSIEQVVEIVNQSDFERHIKVAKDFAVLNSMDELLPGREVLAAVDDRKGDLITIPKPVLTSSEKTGKKPAGRQEDGEKVHLTIVVVGSK